MKKEEIEALLTQDLINELGYKLQNIITDVNKRDDIIQKTLLWVLEKPHNFNPDKGKKLVNYLFMKATALRVDEVRSYYNRNAMLTDKSPEIMDSIQIVRFNL